eukprot:5423446-Amphidinium_carterae.1
MDGSRTTRLTSVWSLPSWALLVARWHSFCGWNTTPRALDAAPDVMEGFARQLVVHDPRGSFLQVSVVAMGQA